MKSFDQFLQSDIASYEGRHDELIYQAPALYRLLTNLLDDPRLPRKLRPLVLSAIAYFILPVDIIPEELEGPYGYVDDIWLVAFVADRVRHEIGAEDILISNWDGEGKIVPLIEEIISIGQDLVGGKTDLILKFIAYDLIE